MSLPRVKTQRLNYPLFQQSIRGRHISMVVATEYKPTLNYMIYNYKSSYTQELFRLFMDGVQEIRDALEGFDWTQKGLAF